MSEGHTGFSLPSIADGSFQTMSASSGLVSPDSKRPCGQMVLHVGGQEMNSETRKTLFHSLDQDDQDDEEDESDDDSPKRTRRKRSAKVNKVKAPDVPPQFEMTSFGDQVMRGVQEEEARRRSVYPSAGCGQTAAGASASSGQTGAGAMALLPVSGPPVTFGNAETVAAPGPVPSTPAPVARKHQQEGPCPYKAEAEAMMQKYNKEREVAARAMMECREVNVLRESQIAQAEREILAAQGGVARAEAVACRAQNHEELAVRQFLVERMHKGLQPMRSTSEVKKCMSSGPKLCLCLRLA